MGFHRGYKGSGGHVGLAHVREQSHSLPRVPSMGSLGMCPGRGVAAEIHWML